MTGGMDKYWIIPRVGDKELLRIGHQLAPCSLINSSSYVLTQSSLPATTNTWIIFVKVRYGLLVSVCPVCCMVVVSFPSEVKVGGPRRARRAELWEGSQMLPGTYTSIIHMFLFVTL